VIGSYDNVDCESLEHDVYIDENFDDEDSQHSSHFYGQHTIVEGGNNDSAKEDSVKDIS